jgi:hypothetical protein
VYTTPVSVAFPARFQRAVTGRDFTCAIHLDGQASCWGTNWFGSLGSGANGRSATPVVVAGDRRYREIAIASFEQVFALTTDGELFRWGGVGGDASQLAPTPAAPGLTFVTMDAGDLGNGFCGITVAKLVYCGSPGSGSLAAVPRATTST